MKMQMEKLQTNSFKARLEIIKKSFKKLFTTYDNLNLG